jgi:leucyl/phenylalanyl-tRNA--protein transferase
MADDSGQGRCPSVMTPAASCRWQNFHIPRRLERWLRTKPYQITCNQAFQQVIRLCGEAQRTWLCPEIEETFCELHYHGWAHSLEAWHQDQLVGGLYGMTLGGTFCGESMFHRAPHASKACLIELYQRNGPGRL